MKVFATLRMNHNTRRALKEYRKSQPLARATPCEIIVDLTNACRIRCMHCYRTYGHNVSTFVTEDVFDRIPQRFYDNVRKIDLSGMGEPTLHPRWDAILERMADSGRRYVTFNTSLTFLADEQIKRMTELGCGVAVSIDATRKETFERIRAGASYDQVFGSLRKMMDYSRTVGHPRFACFIRWVLYKDNLTELPEFIEMVSEMGIQLVFVQPLAPHHEELISHCCDPLDPTTDQWLLKAYATGTAKGVRLFSHVTLTTAAPFKEAIEKNNTIPFKMHSLKWQHPPDSAGCSFPWSQMKIDSAGNIVVCCFSDRVMGNALTDDIEQVWNNAEFQQLRHEVNLHAPAKHCVESYSGGVCCPRVQLLKSDKNKTHFLQKNR